MNRVLHVSPTLTFSRQAVTETFGILAVRGAGKSNTGAVMAEEMFSAGLHFVVVDPVGAWWGLRAGADGKRNGGLQIPIFGGKHGDVPLERGGGQLVADLIVDQRISCVLDLSRFESEAAKKQFLVDFAKRLYDRNEEPLHLFLEEADDYIPQRPIDNADKLLLRAWENIVRRGRSRGLGMTLITQRSAVINKNVLTQVGTLIAMRVTGPQDRDAVEEWLKYNAQGKEILASLSGLEDGEAWVWSPRFLQVTKRVRFRRRKTYDSGATPTAQERRKVATLADVDLKAVTSAMAATIEKAKAEDPRRLQGEVARLTKEVARLSKLQPKAVEARQKVVEQAVLRPRDIAMLVKLSDAVKASREALQTASGLLQRVELLPGKIEAAVTQVVARTAPGQLVSGQRPDSVRPVRAASMQRPDSVQAVRAAPARSASGAPPSSVGTGGLKRILIALAQRPKGLTQRQLGLRAGLSSRSGTFSTYLARARSAGWIEGREHLQITLTGVGALGEYESLPEGAELLRFWLSELGNSGASRMLEALVAVYPRGLSNEELGEAAGISAKSGTFSTYLSRLRGLGLIEGRGELKASEELLG